MNPLQRAAVRRKAFYFAAILAIFSVSIFYRGLEAKTPTGETYVWVPFGRDDRRPDEAKTAINRGADWLARRRLASSTSRYALACAALAAMLALPVGTFVTMDAAPRVATTTPAPAAGTATGEAVSTTSIPRTRPSVDPSATQRTRPPPRCCWTSPVR